MATIHTCVQRQERDNQLAGLATISAGVVSPSLHPAVQSGRWWTMERDGTQNIKTRCWVQRQAVPQWVHSYRRKGERTIMFAINKWWRYCRCRCYFQIVVTIAAMSLPVEIIQPMLILLNYRSKHLKRRWYIYTFQVNPLTHCDALSSKTFYSTQLLEREWVWECVSVRVSEWERERD